jgi:pimeloyl-ACP methyl ester carboxylesterase
MNSHTLNAMSLWMLKSEAVARMQARQFAFPDEGMTADFLADIRAMKAENLDRPIASFAARLFLPPHLDRVTCPVLVLAGSKEPGSMLKSQADIAKAIPGARAVLIPGAKHTYPWTHFEAFNALLSGEGLGPR